MLVKSLCLRTVRFVGSLLPFAIFAGLFLGIFVAPIVSLCNETVGSVKNSPGLYRWMDASYLQINGDGSVTIDNDAPVSQWPKAVQLRHDKHGNLQVTLFRPAVDPITFKEVQTL